ncbi:MAG: adaptor protein MecA [Lachnospiraceae bacterium]|nr:adaptor protein MecA [Lachnospiraceae bacterium]
MKIERLSENQIRCTLYKSDLADKELLLTELAYGTDKAKELFRELMQQASNELGFEVDNIPLMIEAIPVSPECLILIITKVEDPEELDTRFSRFTKPLGIGATTEEDEDEDQEDEEPSKTSPDGLIEALGSLAEGLSALGGGRIAKKVKEAVQQNETEREIFRVYAFKNLNQVIISAKHVMHIYNSENTLYKNPQDSSFYLYLTKDNNTDGEFVKTCNLISEYGNKIRTTYATPSYMEEHYKLIIDGNALQTLSQI